MIDSRRIIEHLTQRWQNGETQASIAKLAGISQAYLCDLISGKSDVEGLTVKTINKLFPDASLHLDGDSISIRADYNGGNVVGVNRGKVTMECFSSIIDKILETEDLTAEEKVKVMKVLKK